ncbi:hypothetical protein FV222_28350, partial [Methylobacterium sp. WL103]
MLFISRLTATADDASAGLAVAVADGFTVSTDRDDGAVVFDIVAKKDLAKADATAFEVVKLDAARAEGAGKAEPKEAAKSEASKGDGGKGEGAKSPTKADLPAPGSRSGASEAAARPPLAEPPERQAGSGLVFPFAKRPPVALFERGGIANLVFETAEPVALPAAGTGTLRAVGEPLRMGGQTVLRFAVPAGALLDLVPVRAGAAAGAWELIAGNNLGPSDT